MESLQLFSYFLLAMAGTHLVFQTADRLGRWLAKGRRPPARAASLTSGRSSWYVFFDPQELYGRGTRTAPGTDAPPRSVEQRHARPVPRRPRQTV